MSILGSPQNTFEQTLTSDMGGPNDITANAELNVDTAATVSGTATRYWARTEPGSTLWLLVNNSWKRLDNAGAVDLDLVQRAFLGNGSNVRVGFNTNNNKVVWLVVEGT